MAILFLIDYDRTQFDQDRGDLHTHCRTSMDTHRTPLKGLSDQMHTLRVDASVFQINKLKSAGPFTPAACGAYVRRVTSGAYVRRVLGNKLV